MLNLFLLYKVDLITEHDMVVINRTYRRKIILDNMRWIPPRPRSVTGCTVQPPTPTVAE